MKEHLKHILDRHGVLVCICLSISITFLVEFFNRGSLVKGLSYMVANPVLFLYNVLIVMLTLSIALFFKRRLLFFSLITFLWLVLGIANGIVLQFRGMPLTLADFSVAMTATSIAGLYLNFFQITLIILGIAVAVLLFVYIKRHEPKVSTNFLKALSVALTIGVFLALPTNTHALGSDFSDLTDAYEDYGFAYCFSMSVLDQGIKKPEDYSPEKVKSLLPETKKPQKESPNVIYLQLESFFDLARMKGLSFSKETMPFFSSLKETCSNGFLSVPSVGGGTANTEFEVLTSMNVNDFGPGVYPYLSLLNQVVCPSAASDLKALGYATHAIHDYIRKFYDRDRVYENIGFDEFVSIEDMQNIEYNPLGWAKDKVLKDEILNALQSTEKKDFIFAVSVQGHGKYPDSYSEPGGIKVHGLSDPAEASQYEYYADQIREMDDFLRELVNALSSYDEDVVLVLYGDHLPSLDITDGKLSSGSVYQTEYLIWSNTVLPEQDEDLEAFQLTAKVFDLLQISGTLPPYHTMWKSSEEYLTNLKTLEYDLVYGEKYALEN